MPTVTNPLHLRPPRWITPSMLPTTSEGCSYSVTFQANDALFYCGVLGTEEFPEEAEADWRNGEDSTSTRYNASYTPSTEFWLQPREGFSEDNNFCLGSGSAFTAITGADGLANEDMSQYTMFDGNICTECVTDKRTLPVGLKLDKFSGTLSGVITDIDEWLLACKDNYPNYKWEEVNACGCPEDFEYDETNYATCGSESLNIRINYRFTVIAVNNAGFSRRTFTLPCINNWTSDRDKFIKNINHTNERNGFMVDGEFVDNETYLTKMKEKGYFPPRSC